MALVAIGVRQLVISSDVTIETGPRLMRPCEREQRRRMIERGWNPCYFSVTRRAIQRELIRGMRWVQRGIVVRLMTLHAICIDELVITADMTGLARLCGMRTLQWELRRRMIERRRPPRREGMTGFAVVRELSAGVIGIHCRVEIGLVALPAICVRQLVIAVDVTGLTRFSDMRAL